MNHSHATPRRVVVTGLGSVGPVGLDVPTAWQRVVAGQSGIGRITLFPTDGFRVKVAGQAWGFDPLAHLSLKQVRRADRNVQFALVAAMEALDHAALKWPLVGDAADETGTCIGSGAGGIETYVGQQAILDRHGPGRMSPLAIPMIVVDSAAVQVSIMAGARGPSMSVTSACSTGSDAVGTAFDLIRESHADAMIAGGTEAAVTKLGIGGFDQMNALSRRNDVPGRASRPFDASRDGFVLSEGAGIVILEELGHAVRRGVEPLAEILGWAATSDAAHFTKPDPEARQAARAITLALEKAEVEADDVGYINAHATGTPQGDSFEVAAVKRALGKAAYDIPISSTKSVTGHLLGGAGATELIWCVMAIRDGILPPTTNYCTKDPSCDLDFVPNVARPASPRIALANSFGMGGHNTVLVVGRWDGQPAA
jgi:3-oxoacyl-[acyl-carrier-protein] synthase II